MGNSNGNIHKYWEEFWNKDLPRLQGGFIWDMVDQGIRTVNKVSTNDSHRRNDLESNTHDLFSLNPLPSGWERILRLRWGF
jgi:beta-galactosidase/beta-glucuronidase